MVDLSRFAAKHYFFKEHSVPGGGTPVGLTTGATKERLGDAVAIFFCMVAEGPGNRDLWLQLVVRLYTVLCYRLQVAQDCRVARKQRRLLTQYSNRHHLQLVHRLSAWWQLFHT